MASKLETGRLRRASAAALAAIALTCTYAAAPAAAADGAAVVEQSALDLLKKSTEVLKAATSLSVDITDMRQLPTSAGPSITLVNELDIDVSKPNKLRAEGSIGGADTLVVYDGKKLSILDETNNVYVTADAPGTLDELLDFAAKQHGLHFAIADFILADPFTALGDGVEVALDAGTTKIDGDTVNHLVFSKPNIEYELWLDAESALPKLFTVNYLDDGRTIHFVVEFDDWKLGTTADADEFTFTPPAGATEIQFLPSDAQ